MNNNTFLNLEDIFIKLDLNSKEEILKKVSNLMSNKLNMDQDELNNLFKIRENYLSTGIGEGIALPHIFDESIKGFNIIFITLKNPVDYNSIDKKPINIIIAIAASPEFNITYLEVVAYFMKILQYKNIREYITKTDNVEHIYKIFSEGKINISEFL